MVSIKIKKKTVAPKHKIESIHIEKADNGLKVRHHVQKPAKRMPGGMASYPGMDTHEHVFTKHGPAKKHIAGLMAQMMPGEAQESPDEEANETPEQEAAENA